MYFPPERNANMNKENAVERKKEAQTARITRARAKLLGTSTGILAPSRPSFKPEQKGISRANAKRSASEENKAVLNAGMQHKKRAVLKDVTNVFCETSYMSCVNAAKGQIGKQARKCPLKKDANVQQNGPVEVQVIQDDVKTELAKELSKIKVVESLEIKDANKCAKRENSENSTSLMHFGEMHIPPSSGTPPKEEDMEHEKSGATIHSHIIDIDSKLRDPQACTPYAPDIYNNIRIAELERRPMADFMEKLQRDITPNMRGILIDWLVEVSEEYKLVPDTLYLTVNLIDRYLSHNYIEKQRLQLLGVACMLIASKYEEICAPRVEEFCFITDSTYTREETSISGVRWVLKHYLPVGRSKQFNVSKLRMPGLPYFQAIDHHLLKLEHENLEFEYHIQVVKMESQVLNLLHFQLSVPTVKTFLRRFIQAAQVSLEVPSIELEYLANYLAELTLVEYSFLEFLPSLIAASAVFLARWTLNQSDNPWNPTLEHYTKYSATELKTTVLAMDNLQLNTSGCSLNAIREKYRQQKFKCVATLTSSEPVVSIFQRSNIS